MAARTYLRQLWGSLMHTPIDWKFLVWDRIQRLGKPRFTLSEMYGFIPEFERLEPRGKHIDSRIRETLQELRDEGRIEFRGRGNYYCPFLGVGDGRPAGGQGLTWVAPIRFEAALRFLEERFEEHNTGVRPIEGRGSTPVELPRGKHRQLLAQRVLTNPKHAERIKRHLTLIIAERGWQGTDFARILMSPPSPENPDALKDPKARSAPPT
jgi:Dam-replacing HTH domain